MIRIYIKKWDSNTYGTKNHSIHLTIINLKNYLLTPVHYKLIAYNIYISSIATLTILPITYILYIGSPPILAK